MKKVGPPGATYNFLAVDAMLMKNVVAAVLVLLFSIRSLTWLYFSRFLSIDCALQANQYSSTNPKLDFLVFTQTIATTYVMSSHCRLHFI